jgi:outer membrane lipoprotein carrier protein
MKRYLSCVILGFSLALPQAAGASSGKQRLTVFLKEISSLRADFQQTLLDPKGKVIQQDQGTVALARPGRFRWEYRKPNEQLIVSDGKKLWIYDPELEQVTVKSVDATLGNTPAVLLSGVHPIDRDFKVKDDGRRSGLEWVRLVPKGEDTSFVFILLGFWGQEIREMELHDSFGQVTRLRFQNVQRNPALSPTLFQFKPPAGVDVIGDG